MAASLRRFEPSTLLETRTNRYTGTVGAYDQEMMCDVGEIDRILLCEAESIRAKGLRDFGQGHRFELYLVTRYHTRLLFVIIATLS